MMMMITIMIMISKKYILFHFRISSSASSRSFRLFGVPSVTSYPGEDVIIEGHLKAKHI